MAAMKTIALTLAALVALAAAAPAPAAPNPLVKNYTAIFEKEIGPNFYEFADVPGPYDALNWTGGFSSPGFCPGACPVVPTTLPAYLSFPPGSPGVQSASYAGSKVAFFSLYQFGGGCQANRTGVPCDIQVRGYRGPAVGLPAAETSFAYVPHIVDNGFGPNDAMTTFSLARTFAGLRTVTYTAVPGKGVVQKDFVGLVDTVAYQVTNATV